MIKNFKRRKVYARFKDNIWAADLAEMRSLSSKNWGVRYLLCVIDAFTKHAWINSLKDKKAKAVLHVFIEIVSEPNCKPNKWLVDQGRKFYDSFVQKWLDDNDIWIYSTHNEGKSVVAESLQKVDS